MVLIKKQKLINDCLVHSWEGQVLYLQWVAFSILTIKVEHHYSLLK